MRFHASPAAIARIVQTKKFTRAPVAACDELRHFDDAPQWWEPRGSACYANDHDDAAFASSSAWLLYDESSRDAHFAYIGVD